MSSQSTIILLLCGELSRFKKAYYDITQKCFYKTLLPWGLRTCQILGFSHNHLIAGPSRSNKNFLLHNPFTGAKTPVPQPPSNYQRAIFSSPPSGPNCLVILFGFHFHYCHLGDQQWGSYKEMNLADVFFLNQKFYSLTYNGGELCIIHFVPEPKLTRLKAEAVDSLQIYANKACRWVLAELDGDLLMIIVRMKNIHDWSRRICAVRGYDVWRWDFKHDGELIKMSNLGKNMLFIGYSGFSVCISTIGTGIRENCIYDIYSCKNNWVVYSFDDGRIDLISPSSPDLVCNHVKVSPIWIIPHLC